MTPWRSPPVPASEQSNLSVSNRHSLEVDNIMGEEYEDASESWNDDSNGDVNEMFPAASEDTEVMRDEDGNIIDSKPPSVCRKERAITEENGLQPDEAGCLPLLRAYAEYRTKKALFLESEALRINAVQQGKWRRSMPIISSYGRPQPHMEDYGSDGNLLEDSQSTFGSEHGLSGASGNV